MHLFGKVITLCTIFVKQNKKQPIMKNANKWALLENGYVHTDCLSKADAEEMLERYSRIFSNIEYCITYLG